MTPTTWFTIVAFFLFVAPGLLFDLLSARKRVQRRESVFSEISRIALVSTFSSVVGALSVVLFGLLTARFNSDILPSASEILIRGTPYIAENLTSLIITAACVVLISLITSWVSVYVIYKNYESGISYTSAWQLMLRVDKPDNSCAHARIRLSDGTTWFGRVAHFSPDSELVDREIILCPPMAVKRGDELKPLPQKWHRVSLKGADITSLAVTYASLGVPPASGNGPTPPSPPVNPPQPSPPRPNP